MTRSRNLGCSSRTLSFHAHSYRQKLPLSRPKRETKPQKVDCNKNPSGTKSIICFNLKSKHNWKHKIIILHVTLRRRWRWPTNHRRNGSCHTQSQPSDGRQYPVSDPTSSKEMSCGWCCCFFSSVVMGSIETKDCECVCLHTNTHTHSLKLSPHFHLGGPQQWAPPALTSSSWKVCRRLMSCFRKKNLLSLLALDS